MNETYMGLIADTLANELQKLNESESKMIAAYEDYIEELQSEIKRLNEER